jgi:uncharacterized protein (TIGR00299 family) protein
MSAILYLDLWSGASGDMLLASLLDLGLSLESLSKELDRLRLPGWRIFAERAVTRGVWGTRVTVKGGESPHPARHLPEVRRMIDSSSLSPVVKTRSLSTFERLARAEAAIHGVPMEKVHFHEIGAVDSIIDIVGFMAAVEILGVTGIHSSPAPLGTGSVETEHGTLPVPAPATLALLAEVGAPTRPHPAETEILTPTAAAILAEVALFSYPAMNLRRIGYGVGAKELPWANILRAWLGDEIRGGAGTAAKGADSRSARPRPDPADPLNPPATVIYLECNLDNARGDDLGHLLDRLLQAGALDVWFTPIQMKKNRPAVLLSVLGRIEDAEDLAGTILRETPTYGVRLSSPLVRVTAGRSFREVRTEWGVVRVKEKRMGDAVVSLDPEYEDCARIAREHGLPISDVRSAAERAAREG